MTKCALHKSGNERTTCLVTDLLRREYATQKTVTRMWPTEKELPRDLQHTVGSWLALATLQSADVRLDSKEQPAREVRKRKAFLGRVSEESYPSVLYQRTKVGTRVDRMNHPSMEDQKLPIELP